MPICDMWNDTSVVSPRRMCAAVLAVVMAVTAFACCGSARAQKIGEELATRLTAPQQRIYVFYLRAHAQYERDLDDYWSAVEERREQRRLKRSAGHDFSPDDFIAVQPPRYAGPALPPDITRIVASVSAAAPPPAKAPEPLPTLPDFLAHARKEYGFIPAPTSETIFKQRYAEEALALGLSKDQVVRVFALETGGRGTYDMQAGIDPATKKGTAISTALGYAQLLAANSVNELAKHGDAFVARLEALSRRRANGPGRVQHLRAKTLAVRRMLRAVRSVPDTWSAHVALARLPKGLGVHALNLDADIGPWLQTIKLKGVREVAEKAGRPQLSGAEIELMNLAGPRTGLDMMEQVARDKPTSNFFARAAYYRNTIVRDKSAADLLKALEARMDVNLRQTGSIEFAAAFDKASVERRLASGSPAQR